MTGTTQMYEADFEIVSVSRGVTTRSMANSYQSLGRNYWLRLQDNLPQDRGSSFVWNVRTFLLLHVVSHPGTSLSSGAILLINSCIGYYNKRDKMLSTQRSQHNRLLQCCMYRESYNNFYNQLYMNSLCSTDISMSSSCFGTSQIPLSASSHSFRCNALEIVHWKIMSKFTGKHLHT